MQNKLLRRVEALPVLDQSAFPEITHDPNAQVVIPFGSTLREIEKEFVLGIMRTAAIRKGSWYPTPTNEFMRISNEAMKLEHFVGAQHIVNTVWKLAEEGLLEMVRFDGENDYVVPTPDFAHVLSQPYIPVCVPDEDRK